MKLSRLAAIVIAVVSMVGCSSLDRINQTMGDADKDYDLASKKMNEAKSLQPVVKEARYQWINTVPILEPTKHSNVPRCLITINRKGAISINEIAQRISGACKIPVTVTPDALAVLNRSGGTTQQISGNIPAPDNNGMVPLDKLGGSPQNASIGSSDTLNGLYWNGELSGLLDTVSSRYGISSRFSNGRIYFYYLETKSFAIEFMDSKAEFNSRVVSGTTSSAGTTGANSTGAIAGDSNTSQTTTMEIKSSLYEDLQSAVKTMLTPNVGRMFLASGSLTVTDSPDVIDAVGRFIKDRNKELNRQVVLNVEVLSVQKTKKDQLGIDWDAVFKSGSLGLSLANSFGGVADSAMSGGLTIVDGKFAGSKAFVRALSEQAKVSVVTQQSSTTTNLSPLPMQVAEQEDYVAQVTTDSTANVGTSTSITPATITTGFNMTLLPYIMPDGVNMQLQFSMSLSDQPTRRPYTSGESTIELLNTKLKTVNQRVNMKTGQTIIMSGFQQVNKKGSKQGVGEAGFFGFGGGQSAEDSNTLLVILITPVIPSGGVNENRS